MYARQKSDWAEFSKAVVTYMNDYGSKVSAKQMNEFAWTVFENCSDMNCVEQALEWSKKSVDVTNNPAFMDTYANLLYKTGKKQDAISWEEKAITMLKQEQQPVNEYEATLEKFKSGK